jgi:Cdc6-like AAA superfamily ATPase
MDFYPTVHYECNLSITDLRLDLRNHLFGQHIVQEIVPAAIESSIDKHSPTKPLVLSFHGPTGVGKNYVSSFIAQNYFQNGESSKFYHYFNSRKDFPYQDKYLKYQVRQLYSGANAKNY